MPHSDEGPRESLSPLAIGYMWSTRILSLSIEMGLIVMAFYWLDRKLATTPVFTIIGTLTAVTVFIVQMIAMTKKLVSHPSEENSADKSE
ncbi:MAG: hypothetical protein ACOX6D_02475 [Thermoguttaceae bacterium]|jgi:hypothetical protein